MQTSVAASSKYFIAEVADCLIRAKKRSVPRWCQPAAASRIASRTVLRVPEIARTFNCRLFHHKRLMGPFGDLQGSYFLCEIGHRIPLNVLPAAKPKPKLKVWNEENLS